MEDFDNLDAMLNSMEEEQKPDVKEPETTEPAEPAESPKPQEQTVPEVKAPEVKEDPVNPEEILQGTRQNQAFAQMRVKQREYEGVLGKMAEVLGVPPGTSHEQMVQIVQNRLMEYEAKSKQIPVELLQRMQQQDQLLQRSQEESFRQQANLGFKNVQETFQLDQKELKEFAIQLRESNKDPYVTPMNLVQEYKMLNYDKLVEREREKARQEALKLDKKASTQSSSPSGQKGAPSTSAETVASVQDLDKLLAGFN